MSGFLMPVAPDPYEGSPVTFPPEQLGELTIFIPIWNEPRQTLRRSVDGVLGLDYPRSRLTVRWVVAANRDKDQRNLHEVLDGFRGNVPSHWGALIVPDVSPRGRALNHALSVATSEWIGLLDADSVPDPDQARQAVALLMSGCVEFAEASEFQEISSRRDRVLAAQNCAFLASMTFMKQHLGWRFLASSSVYFSRRAAESVGGYIEHEAEEGFNWSIDFARSGFRSRRFPSESWGLPATGLGRGLLQRSRWMRGQLAASTRVVEADLPPRVRAGLCVAAASLLAQAAILPLALLAIRLRAARRALFLMMSAECLRVAAASRAVEARQQRLGIAWALLPAFEVAESTMFWFAVFEVASKRRSWHGIRGSAED